MSAAPSLADQLSAYAAGLEAEVALLRQIARLSAARDELGDGADLDRLNATLDARAQMIAALVTIEAEIRPVRHALAADRAAAAALPGYDEVSALHTAAKSLLGDILSSDRRTSDALREAELVRRSASRAVDTGESTLEAYRRVIAPPVATPTLIERRG
jgi:hypothetical protein